MNAVGARRWTDDQGTVWFAAGVLGRTYQQAAERVLMDYERAGPEWRRGYPDGTPHLDRAWENFSACIERVLRQAARLEPVPWRDALRELCQRAAGQSISWWLAGSTALAVRGAPIEPGDLDIVCDAGDAVTIGELFSDSLIEPVTTGPADWLGEWQGRAFWGGRGSSGSVASIRSSTTRSLATSVRRRPADWSRSGSRTGRSGSRRWTCSGS